MHYRTTIFFFFRSEYLFNFDEAFEIHDDIEVLKRMGLSFGLEKGECGDKNLRAARTMVPKALEPYVSRKFLPPYVYFFHQDILFISVEFFFFIINTYIYNLVFSKFLTTIIIRFFNKVTNLMKLTIGFQRC